MTIEGMELTRFVPGEASPDDWRRLAHFTHLVAAEEYPDDPLLSEESIRQSWLNIPPIILREAWLVRRPDGEVIAALYVDLITMEENRHLAQLRISVLPAARRQGIGTLLLEKASEIVEAEGRRLMVANTTNLIPAGEHFMTAIGAQAAMKAVTNQLVMAEVPDGLLQQWIDQGRRSSDTYQLGFWEGSYPHEALESMARIRQAMNEAPLDDLEVNDMEWTPEMLMQYDATLEARKIKRWTFYVQENDTGEVVGYTEMFWSPDKPALGQQGDTAVLRAHRNHGLGRWLKAEMLQKVRTEKPYAAHVRTGNANSNAPMLRINHELGFAPYRAEILWQVPLATVQSYLESKKGDA